MPADADRAVRLAFLALLATVLVAPELASTSFDYPAISHAWVVLPLSGLLLAGVADVRPRLAYLDLLAVCAPMAAGALAAGHDFAWAALAPYPPLAYLAVRMLRIARPGGRARDAWRPAVPARWLAPAAAALVVVHILWALHGVGTLDVGYAGVRGAQAILHGQPLYGRPAGGPAAPDPHLDTYGPFDYEAYVPFAAAAPRRQAARLAALAFDLLTAALLLGLGWRRRRAAWGVRLAFAWLATPLTLYSDSVSFNDALVAATLVGALLCLGRPLGRGAAAALAGWVKFTPLAVAPLLLVAGPPATRRSTLRFALAFLVTSAVVFAPALAHDSASTILERTVGFQAGRGGAASIWALFGGEIDFPHPAWTTAAAEVVHGLLVAATVGLALAMARLPLRRDVAGVAAAGAAVTILTVMCVSYLAVGYALWFLPLVLLAVLDPASG